MRRLARAVLVSAALLSAGAAQAFYDLEPVQVADGVYAFEGRLEHFSRDNAGNIVNTGFIVTDAGVIVIDTGPSRRYGLAMREAIADVTDQPVVAVYVTHHHPDHYLGNEAFDDALIAALPRTREVIEREGDEVTNSLYRSVGDAMRGTEPVVPPHTAEPGLYEHAGRSLEFLAVAGHSGPGEADLMILDRMTGVLFAGDVVFHDRAPTTPHADPDAWIETLHELEQRIDGGSIRTVVPGHGPLEGGVAGVRQTRDYLVWLRARLEEAVNEGMHAAELMYAPVPEPWSDLAVIEAEYPRSVAHLYPRMARQRLEQAAPEDR